MKLRRVLMALLPLSVVLASAHPGHGLMEHGAGHVATSAYHLLVLAGAAGVMFGAAQFVRSQSARKYLRVAGSATLLIAGALWGLGI